ncbi:MULTISPECIES: lipopolysaccharide transport periplasmic protein LptA [Shimia]|uniref:lipopolysaccharide transport periplasmic protein LptA n=1 Tax=Shimia TaxID=573139 RepID=UPI001FB1B50F|nr:lipopolysaccharide transport periplasmic protein LptA [Shimia sp. FJ5]MDV4144589.1 lipopolysaccharide transport periplasmic protein LptA [Shimia sp. FJ5]
MSFIKVFFISLALALPSATLAQGFEVAFGTSQENSDLPVEVNADSLSVDQENGTAIFRGNVRIKQGTMRMSAPEVHVFYNDSNSGIARLEGFGGVLLVDGPDAAESKDAVYRVEDSIVVMTGDVLVTQGTNTLQSQRMTVNLETGTAQMEGRVKTIMRTEDN